MSWFDGLTTSGEGVFPLTLSIVEGWAEALAAAWRGASECG